MKISISMEKPPKGWSKFKGDSYINPNGATSLLEVFDRTMFDAKNVAYYLFIAYDGKNYYPGHGGVVMKGNRCNTAKEASVIAEKWFKENQ